ncbi:MAG: glycosyltransferase family 2 protein [Hyphomonadaceae bacterium]|nr:glycosyltransferase family 2 protein [Hyphomonadaceae bacterium]
MQDSVINPATVRDVDVCVCTFRRASVTDLLASLARLETPGWRMRVIVADNDDKPSARETVERAFTSFGLNGLYVHAPARNISVARNACLNAARAPLIAFIDDDETARPDWLAQLISRHEATSAGVVFGKVMAIYAPDAPRWMPVADMHSTPPPIRNGEIVGGYTCNVLMRRDVVGALRFDPAYGRSGGEDTTFFAQLQRAGVVMVYTEKAVVDEPIPPSRSTLEWLKIRAFRAGQTWGLLELRNGKPKAVLVGMSLAKMAFCVVMAGLTFWSPARWRRAIVRSRLHAGVMGAATGKAPLELYGEAGA